MTHKFDMDAFNERMLKKLHPPTASPIQRLRGAVKRRITPKLPRL